MMGLKRGIRKADVACLACMLQRNVIAIPAGIRTDESANSE
jgi:hypothetical protein